MSKKIYTCDACHYTFEAQAGCDQCPDCGKKHYIYGESHVKEIASKHGIRNTVQLPINPKLSAAFDKGMTELSDCPEFSEFADKIIK